MIIFIFSSSIAASGAISSKLTVIKSDVVNNQKNVDPYQSINIKFNSAIVKDKQFNNISLKGPYNTFFKTTKTIVYDTLTIKAEVDLQYNTKYSLIIPKGSVKNYNGKSISNDIVINFTTKQEEKQQSSNNYLIILDNSSLKASVENFAAFKKDGGYNVKIICSDQINGKGTDNAEKLRSYLISQEKKDNLEYVLLIGDPFVTEKANPQETGGNIPMKYLYDFSKNHNVEYYSDFLSLKPNPDGTLKETGNIPSDIFYAFDIDWDADKDGYSGESIEDISANKNRTLKCMFKVGRIPFSDPDSIKSILENSIDKEKEYKLNNLKPKALIAAGIIGFSPMIDGAEFAFKLKSELMKSNADVTTLTEQEGIEVSKYIPDLQLNRENFSKKWNEGYDFICTEAHGGTSRYCWKSDNNGNGRPDGGDNAFFEDFFIESDLVKSNGFLLMSGCATARVENDRYSFDGVQIPNLLKKKLITAGVGTTKSIGYNRDSLSYSLLPFWSSKSNTYGDCFYNALNDMFRSFKNNEHEKYDFYHNLYSYYYLGDPSFKVPRAN